jgi:hypothetical protein
LQILTAKKNTSLADASKAIKLTDLFTVYNLFMFREMLKSNVKLSNIKPKNLSIFYQDFFLSNHTFILVVLAENF